MRATEAKEIPRCLPSNRADHHPQGRRRGLQRGHHDRQVIDHRRTTRPIEITEPRDARLLIAAPPGQHRGPRHPDPAADLRVRRTLSSEQNDPGALGTPAPAVEHPNTVLNLDSSPGRNTIGAATDIPHCPELRP